MNIYKLNQKKRLVKGKLVVGLDLAKTSHVAVPMLPDGVVVGKPFGFGQDRESFETFWAKCQEIQAKHQTDGLAFAMEATGSYWEPLAHYFADRQVDLLFVHGRVVKSSRLMMDLSRSKNDPKDAYVIAQVASEGKFMEIRQPTGVWAELRNLGLLRVDLMKDWVAWGNRIRAIQDKYWPERETILKNCLRETSIYLFEKCPFPSDVLRLGELGLLQLVLEGSNKRRGKNVAAKLMASARESIGIKEGQEAARLELRRATELVRLLSDNLREVEAKLVEVAAKTGYLEPLISIRGISAVGAALLLGEIGDPARYKNAKEWVKLAGLNLVENQSGKMKREGKRISRIGRSVLRHLLYNLCIPILRHNADFRVSFLRMKNNGKHSMKAMVAAMCRLLRVTFALCRTKLTFNADPNAEKLLEQLMAQQAARKAEMKPKKAA